MSKIAVFITFVLLVSLSGCNSPKALTPSSSAIDVCDYLVKKTDFSNVELSTNAKDGTYSGTCVHGETEMNLAVTVTETEIKWEAASESKRTETSDGNWTETGSTTLNGTRSL